MVISGDLSSSPTFSGAFSRRYEHTSSKSQYKALPGFFSAYLSEKDFEKGSQGADEEYLKFAPRFENWKQLYQNLPPGAKLLILARHGQGFHNAAEAKYGTKAWEEYWAKLDGDGESNWFDAKLTDLGKKQAKEKGNTRFLPIVKEIGFPHRFYSSPLRRCLETFIGEWAPVFETKYPTCEIPVPLHVVEGLRETLGVHTCDARVDQSVAIDSYHKRHLGSSKAELHLQYRPGFPNHDPLWSKTHRETIQEIDIRLAAALDEVLSDDASKPDDRFIVVTTHSCAIEAALRTLTHPPVHDLPTSGLVFLVVAKSYDPPVSLIPDDGTCPVLR